MSLLSESRQQLGCLVVFVGICLLLAGCRARPVTGKTPHSEDCYAITDDSGYTMMLAKDPKRIVSLAYSLDEILVELVDPERILAFSRWADDPEITFITSEQAGRVAKRAVPYAEALIELKPDLIIAAPSNLRPEAVQTLREAGIPVYLSKSPKTVAEVKQKVTAIAKAVGEEAKGQTLTAQMDERLQQLEAKLAQVTPDKWKSCMAFDFIGVIGSKNSLLADIFRQAHLRNGALQAGVDQGENRLAKEQIIAVNPDIFMLPTWNYDGRSDADAYRQQIITDPALQHVAAVRNQQVELVHDRYRYVASQHVVESIEAFAKTAYPELF